MQLTKEDIIRFVKEERVKSIVLAFCDIFGKEKNIVIHPEELKTAFEVGIPFNAAELKNFGEGIFRDLLLHPEPETFSDMPWRDPDDKAIRMYCNMTYADGKPFTEHGTKSLLIQAISEAEAAGYEFYFSTEIEFYLLLLDSFGKPTKEPFDEAGLYDILPDDKSDRIRRKMLRALEQMEIYPNNAFHEEGPGQNKISFGYLDPLTAGNHITTLKAIIKNEAANANLYADFSPKPLRHQPGNGFHVSISVRSNDGSDGDMAYAVAGIINRIRDITAFLNPMRESYERLTRQGAPKYVSWSSENREQLFRVPDVVGSFRKAELRSPDSTANPYLVFALLIFAALEGIRNRTQLDPVCNFDLDSADEATLAGLQMLPQNFEEACEIAKNSDFIKEHISEGLLKMYLNRI
ncbi:MAG: glutamine synthetase [Eubacterium sp.]|nr:glutamine synthetase [Eubacterium sp.]